MTQSTRPPRSFSSQSFSPPNYIVVMHSIPPRSDAGAGSVLAPGPFGKVYSPHDLAELWQLSENSIRRLFQDEPGVFVMGNPSPRGRRGYCTLRIPEAIAVRVWRKRGGA